MATLTVSVPESTKEWIDEQVEAGGYSDANAFVNDVLRDARQQQDGDDTDALRRIVAESRAAGMSNRTLNEIFAEALAVTKARGTWRE